MFLPGLRTFYSFRHSRCELLVSLGLGGLNARATERKEDLGSEGSGLNTVSILESSGKPPYFNMRIFRKGVSTETLGIYVRILACSLRPTGKI